MRYPTLLAALVLAAASSVTTVTAASASTAAGVRPPNVVLILADDLGYGDVGCYGQTVIPTPHIDRLAAEGVRFTQFYAGSTVCAPSRNVLFTGEHTGHIQIRGNRKLNLRPDDPSLGAALRAAGYRTALIGKWGLGLEGSDSVPTQRGFDHFVGYLDQTHAHNSYPTFLFRDEARFSLPNVVPDEGPYGEGVATVRQQHSADVFITEALDFIAAAQDQPFFLYFATTLPHANNQAGDDGMEAPADAPRDFVHADWPKPERDFAAVVARLDADVGRILTALQNRGLADNTLVIFTSDNGPHAEGGHDPEFFGSRGGLRGIKRDLYEGGVRVPTVVRWPGHIPAGTTSAQIGWFTDFLPTLCALVPSASPPPPGDGINLLPVLLDPARTMDQDRPLYWEFYEQRSAQAVRQGRWKAVRIPLFDGPIELYDLETDPIESHDVAAAHPEVVARLAATMTAAHRPHPLWQPPAPAEPKPAP